MSRRTSLTAGQGSRRGSALQSAGLEDEGGLRRSRRLSSTSQDVGSLEDWLDRSRRRSSAVADVGTVAEILDRSRRRTSGVQDVEGSVEDWLDRLWSPTTSPGGGRSRPSSRPSSRPASRRSSDTASRSVHRHPQRSDLCVVQDSSAARATAYSRLCLRLLAGWRLNPSAGGRGQWRS